MSAPDIVRKINNISLENKAIDLITQNLIGDHHNCSGLTVYYHNVHGLRTKISDLTHKFHAHASHFQPDVIIFVETW